MKRTQHLLNYNTYTWPGHALDHNRMEVNWLCSIRQRPYHSSWLGVIQTLVHKYVIPCNYQHIQPKNNLWIWLSHFNKNPFPKFNWNIVINEHHALIVDFDSMWSNIIFGTIFLDTSNFLLDYDANLVLWMGYDVPLCNTSEFSSTPILWCKTWTNQHA